MKSLFTHYVEYKVDRVLLAKGMEPANPAPRLDVVLSSGQHVGALIAWALAAIFVGLVMAAYS